MNMSESEDGAAGGQDAWKPGPVPHSIGGWMAVYLRQLNDFLRPVQLEATIEEYLRDQIIYVATKFEEAKDVIGRRTMFPMFFVVDQLLSRGPSDELAPSRDALHRAYNLQPTYRANLAEWQGQWRAMML